MKKRAFIFALLVSSLQGYKIPENIRVAPWVYATFHQSMQTQFFSESVARTYRVLGIQGTVLLDFFKRLYEKNNPSHIIISSTPIIPKKIHQIWIGSEVPYEAFGAFMESWKINHPDWEYKLWTDEDVKKLTLYNQAFYDATDNPGTRSDILKWEIIYRFGGVYVDIDHECIKPLDILHHTCHFYTGLQPLDTQYVQMGAALFAAVPGHPILKHCVESIKDDWHLKGAVSKSGPRHFMKSILLNIDKTPGLRDIVLPAHYFYPQGCTSRELFYERWAQAGAYAIHHWAKSWMPPQYRDERFKNLNNDESTKSWND